MAGTAGNTNSTDWRALALFAAYHLVLGSGLLILQRTGQWDLLGSRNPAMFSTTAWAFVAVSPVALLFALRQRPAFQIQIHAVLVFDIIALTLLMHASGGIGSGIGVLLAVSLAIGSLAASGATAFAFAALASAAVVAEQSISHLVGITGSADYPRIGLLSTAFFAIAFLAYVLSSRLRTSEQQVRRQEVDLADLNAINALVIDLLDIGVLAVDEAGQVRTINHNAAQWLGTTQGSAGPNHLSGLDSGLHEHFMAWRRTNGEPVAPIMKVGARELSLTFKALPRGAEHGALILLRDMEHIRDEHHKTKLAAIGQMAASITHEIRNPLSAISQAAQLLQEPADGGPSSNAIADIILRNSRRLNASVENILSLSRKRSPVPSPVDLCPFVDNVAAHISALPVLASTAISVVCRAKPLAMIDPGQLDEVLNILCENAARHAGLTTQLEIQLSLGTSNDGKPYIDVTDNGKGIPPETADKVFEPFFSTADSTGLGLFLAKELCALNQASLRLVRNTQDVGTRFRIRMLPA